MATPYNQYRYGDGLSLEETKTIRSLLFMFLRRMEQGDEVNWRQVKKVINKEIQWRRNSFYYTYPCKCSTGSCFICQGVFK